MGRQARTRTKNIYPLLGKLTIRARITDVDGETTTQTGQSWVENMKTQFKAALAFAVMHATYKHYAQFGYQGFKGKEYKISDVTKRVEILNYHVTYGNHGDVLTIRRVNVNGKYRERVKDKKGAVLDKKSTRSYAYRPSRKSNKKLQEYIDSGDYADEF